MLGIGLALGSSLAWGISDFLGGLQSRRFSTLTVLLVSQPIALAISLVVALIAGGDTLGTEDAIVSILAGAVVVVALGAFYRGMALGSVSVVATIAALGVIVPVAVGLAQGEEPAAVQGIGALCAIAGVVLVSREPDPEWRSAGRAAIGLAALAALGFGLYFVLIDSAAPPEPAWTIVLARAGGVGILLIAAAFARPSMQIPRGTLPVLAAIGVGEVTASTLFALATNHGLLSLVSVAGSLYSAVTVLLAWIFLGEQIRGTRRIGVVLALGGVAAIAAGA